MSKSYALMDYGMYLSNETFSILAETVCGFEKEDWEDDDVGCIEGVCEELSYTISAVGEFTGVVTPVASDGSVLYGGEIEFEDDTVYYIPIARDLCLFSTAYEDIDEVIAEFKRRIGEYLPDDFDYERNLCQVFGVFYDM